MPSTAEELKSTLDEFGRTWEEFKKTNNTNVSKVVKDVLGELKLDKVNDTLVELSTKRTELENKLVEERTHREELERKVNLLTANPAKKADEKEIKGLQDFNMLVQIHAREKSRPVPQAFEIDSYRLYCKAFDKMMRCGEKTLDNDETKAMQVGLDPDGGYLVPVDYSGQLVQAIFDLSPIRQIASVQAISSDRLDGIEDTNEASAGWVGEIQARPETATPQVGRWEIVAQELYAAPKATQRLLDDAAIDAEAWLASKVADKMSRVEGAAFCVGNGVTQPRGLFSYASVQTGDNTRTWGQVESVKTGANGAFVADPNGADPFFDLIAAFRPAYLQNARWVTRRSVIAKIRKMKATTGNYLWQPGLTAGAPDMLIGYPITMAEDTPALATGSLSMAFGDFKRGYQIVDRLGVRTLRDPFTNKPYVIFYTTKRTGGAVLNYQAIKFMLFST